MRDVIDSLDQWLSTGTQVALATVVKTWGSAPRQVGAKMAVTDTGNFVGSVSGGCVESAVVDACLESMNSGQPKLLSFGVSDETAWDVGLACGGRIEVFVEPLPGQTYNMARGYFNKENKFAIVSLLAGPEGRLGKKVIVGRDGDLQGTISPEIDRYISSIVNDYLEDGQSGIIRLEGIESNLEPPTLFIDVILPPKSLIIVGGVHIAKALATNAKTLGYQTTIIDPRRAFGSKQRFPDVDKLVQAWPVDAFKEIPLTAASAVASLSHDPKIDDTALRIALASKAFYIGALGSKKTHRERCQRLKATGVSEQQLSMIHGPIGIDIGAQTPEEIAISILAEIIAVHHKLL